MCTGGMMLFCKGIVQSSFDVGIRGCIKTGRIHMRVEKQV